MAACSRFTAENKVRLVTNVALKTPHRAWLMLIRVQQLHIDNGYFLVYPSLTHMYSIKIPLPVDLSHTAFYYKTPFFTTLTHII